MIPSSPITSVKNDGQVDERGSFENRGYSVNTPWVKGLLASHILYQSCSKGFSNNTNDHSFSQSKLLEDVYPVQVSSMFHVTCSADRNVEVLKEENTVVKDSRKKGTKMEKQKWDPCNT